MRKNNTFIIKIVFKIVFLRLLKIVFSRDESYAKAPSRSNKILVHQKHIRILATKIDKAITNYSAK